MKYLPESHTPQVSLKGLTKSRPEGNLVSKPDENNLEMKRTQKLKHNRLEGSTWIAMVGGS